MLHTITSISFIGRDQKATNAIQKAFMQSPYDFVMTQYGTKVTIDVYTSNRDAVMEIYDNAVDNYFADYFAKGVRA